MNSSKKILLVIAGPTASGKTQLAIHLAKHFHTEILSADSRQFYKELPIGTAAPNKEELLTVKHHFVGHLSIFDRYNVSKYEKEVLQLLEQLWKKHHLVIMEGGSGLYINAVCHGIDELPDPDLSLRQQLEMELQTNGIVSLQKQLNSLDPIYYEYVDKKNPKRLMRAIEVCLQTGKKYSELRINKPQPREFRCIKIGLELPRAQLFERINHRADTMIKSGWIDEAKTVFPHRRLNALNTVGYKELFAWIEGKMSFDFAIEKIKTSTRRYSKRQMTWFKKEKEIHWFQPADRKEIIEFVNKSMNIKNSE